MKPLSTGYDLTKHPHADEPDPIAWFLGTGEDIGLPPGWLDAWNKRLSENLAKAKGEKRHHPGGQDHDQTDHGNWSSGAGSGTPKAGQAKELEKKAEAGGFSYRRITGAPADGFMVSPYPQAERKYSLATFNFEDVRAYRERNRELLAKPDHYLGGWRDGDIIYLDVSIRAPTEEAGRQVAREYKQLAIYDIKTGREIKTEEAA